MSFLIHCGEIQEYFWLDEVAISSRNFEVFSHAGAEMPTGSPPLFVPVSQLELSTGLYYPPNSLKTGLSAWPPDAVFILHQLEAQHPAPAPRQTRRGCEDQHEYLAKMRLKVQALRAPPHWNHSTDPRVLLTEILSGDAACERVPQLAREIMSAF